VRREYKINRSGGIVMRKGLIMFLLLFLTGCKTVYVEVPVPCDCECDTTEEETVEEEVISLLQINETPYTVGDEINIDGVLIKLADAKLTPGERYEQVLFTTWGVENYGIESFDFYYDVDVEILDFEGNSLTSAHAIPEDDLLQMVRNNYKILVPEDKSSYGRSFHNKEVLTTGKYMVKLFLPKTDKYYVFEIEI
jgi:hypothetical protein